MLPSRLGCLRKVIRAKQGVEDLLVQQVEEKVYHDRHVTLDILRESFDLLDILDQIVSESLRFKKLPGGCKKG